MRSASGRREAASFRPAATKYRAPDRWRYAAALNAVFDLASKSRSGGRVIAPLFPTLRRGLSTA